MKDWQRVEAILFGSGKYLTEEQISQLSGVPKKSLKKALADLKKHYVQADTSLAVFNEADSWKLNVKEEFSGIVRNVISEAEMPRAVMETLAIIAYRSPVMQSDVIDARGSGAYDHIALLEDKEFITKERFGRTFKLRTTQKFLNYFDLSDTKMRKLFRDAKKPATLGNLEVYNAGKPKPEEDEEKEFDARVVERMKKIEQTPHDEAERNHFLEEFDKKYTRAKSSIDETDGEMNEFRRKEEPAQQAAQGAPEGEGERIAKQLEGEIDDLESIKSSLNEEDEGAGEGSGAEFFAGGGEEGEEETEGKKKQAGREEFGEVPKRRVLEGKRRKEKEGRGNKSRGGYK
jgi:segregation and condensation protein B